MTRLVRTLLTVVVAASAWACAASPVTVPTERYAEHVKWLADDARQGRQTGSTQLRQVAAYIASEFRQAGLEPAGDDGDWYQVFSVSGDRVLGSDNALTAGSVSLALREEWIPFPSAATGLARAQLVFAGYGISDPEGGYDDYDGLDVEGRIVIVLRRGPRASLVHERDPIRADEALQAEVAERSPYLSAAGRGHMSFASKINTAYQHGAAGILVVNDPRSYPAGSEADETIAYDSSGWADVSASLPAAHVTAHAGRKLLSRLGFELSTLQDRIDRSMQPQSFLLPDARASLRIDADREKVVARNVVGILKGSDPFAGDEHVLVGAHMDHVGMGRRSGSLGGADAVGRIHNGADDNASGTAAVIELAHALGRRDDLRRSVLFVAFGAEEWGLLGSRHYVESPALPVDELVAMINMDMIGRAVKRRVEVGGLGTSPMFPMLVAEAHAALGDPLDLSLSEGVVANSDHAPFLEHSVPVLTLFTGLHDDYHRPTDDVEKINYADAAVTASLAGEFVARLARVPGRPAFTDPPAAPHATAEAHEGQEVVGYGVVFGSQPDMAYRGEDGVRISAARAGSPAERAGLLPGDIIVALDGKPIRNLEDYSVLLFSHRPGDRIVVTVKRDGQVLDLEATLEGPQRGN